MYIIVISEEATLDVAEALEWYKKRSSKLSERLKTEINLGFEYIRKTPFYFQLKFKDVRVYYCNSFPYGIHFIIENETIKVIAVFHTSRDPQNWQKRKS
jgi:plasmid stabilization system protein ParE